MKTKNYLSISKVCIISTFLIIVCSSSIQPIKAIGETEDKTLEGVSPLQIDRNTMESRQLKFPISNNISNLCSFQQSAYRHYLATPIRYYRRVMGTYPESMSSFVRSGFPLHWPRNVLTGAPVGVLVGRDFNLDKSDLGLIKWQKFSDDHAKLTFVDLDYKAYRNAGQEIWIERSIEFKWWKKWETWNGEAYEYELCSRREGHPADTAWAIDVMGGTMPINDVPSKENRIIYGMCAQIATHVDSSSGWVLLPDRTIGFVLPMTFRDLYNESNLIILENFANFSDLIKSSGADFRVGFDYGKSAQYSWLKIFDYGKIAQYSWLKIGDETLIVFCQIHNPNSEDSIESHYGGIQYGYKSGKNIDPYFVGFWLMADMSIPMITTNNLAQLEIPNEIAVSIEDIPLGD